MIGLAHCDPEHLIVVRNTIDWKSWYGAMGIRRGFDLLKTLFPFACFRREGSNSQTLRHA